MLSSRFFRDPGVNYFAGGTPGAVPCPFPNPPFQEIAMSDCAEGKSVL